MALYRFLAEKNLWAGGKRGSNAERMNDPFLKRARAWLVCVACALHAGAALADDGPAPPLGVWAIGLPHGFVTMEHQVAAIEVTADDVARGEVRVRAGSRIVVTTRDPAPHAVEFRARPSFASALSIEGLSRTVNLGATETVVVLAHAVAGRQVFELDYRFALAPGVIPGTYAWPLQIAVRRGFEPTAAAR
jgi:hypothetical protein